MISSMDVMRVLECQALIMGMGRRSTISMSKSKNRTANRKNREEKGIRAEDFGSNPHSNGEDFSRFMVDFMARLQAKAVINKGINMAKIMENIGKIIGIGDGSHN